MNGELQNQVHLRFRTTRDWFLRGGGLLCPVWGRRSITSRRYFQEERSSTLRVVRGVTGCVVASPLEGATTGGVADSGQVACSDRMRCCAVCRWFIAARRRRRREPLGGASCSFTAYGGSGGDDVLRLLTNSSTVARFSNSLPDAAATFRWRFCSRAVLVGCHGDRCVRPARFRARSSLQGRDVPGHPPP